MKNMQNTKLIIFKNSFTQYIICRQNKIFIYTEHHLPSNMPVTQPLLDPELQKNSTSYCPPCLGGGLLVDCGTEA